MEEVKERLRNRELESLVVEVEVPPSGSGSSGKNGFNIDLTSLTNLTSGLSGLGPGGGQMAISLDRLLGSRKEKKRMTIGEVRAVQCVCYRRDRWYRQGAKCQVEAGTSCT